MAPVLTTFRALLVCFLLFILLLTMHVNKEWISTRLPTGSDNTWLHTDRRAATIAHNKTSVKKMLKQHCNVYNLRKPISDVYNCLPLDVTPPVKICVHSMAEDTFIYSSILKDGLFEPQKVRMVEQILRTEPEYGLLDIGANIGQYSLIAANMGHQVVSVEPLAVNVRRFHKAVQMAGFQDRITLVNNVVSDRRDIVKLHPRPDNKGGTFVEQNGTLTTYPETICTGSCNFTIPSIYMDDLLEVIPFKKCFMKIDIEGFERIAFKRADKLFDELYIPVVFMEWVFYARMYYKTGYETDVKNLISFMVNRNYEAFSEKDVAFQSKLDTSGTRFLDWDWEVVWKLKGARIFPIPYGQNPHGPKTIQ